MILRRSVHKKALNMRFYSDFIKRFVAKTRGEVTTDISLP